MTLHTVTVIIVTMYQVFFTNKAKTQYKKLGARLKKQVDKAIERISKNPQSGKPLRGELRGIWCERVATFRLLYKIKKKEIEILILLIEHRKSVYGDH